MRTLPDPIKALIEHEYASDWALASRIPSTSVWRDLAYLRALSPDRRARFLEESTERAIYLLDRTLDPRGGEAWDEHRQMANAVVSTWDWHFVGVRLLRGLRADLDRGPAEAREAYPAEFFETVDSIRPTNAAQIRKEVKRVLGDRFHALPENRGGGNWQYACRYGNRVFAVGIDYGGLTDQLRYEVAYEEPGSGLCPKHLNYERLIGVGVGGWDYVTTDNLSESIGLLGDLIERLVQLPELLEAESADTLRQRG